MAELTPQKQAAIDRLIKETVGKAEVLALIGSRYSGKHVPYQMYLLSTGHTVFVNLGRDPMTAYVSEEVNKAAQAKYTKTQARIQKAADAKAARDAKTAEAKATRLQKRADDKAAREAKAAETKAARIAEREAKAKAKAAEKAEAAKAKAAAKAAKAKAAKS